MSSKSLLFFQSGMHMRGLEIRHVYVHHLLCSAMVTARYLQLLKVLLLNCKSDDVMYNFFIFIMMITVMMMMAALKSSPCRNFPIKKYIVQRSSTKIVLHSLFAVELLLSWYSSNFPLIPIVLDHFFLLLPNFT